MPMQEMELRAITRRGEVFVSASDMIESFEYTVRVYREAGLDREANAIQAELDDFRATVTSRPLRGW